MNWVQQSEEVTDLYLYDYISHEKTVDRETGEVGPEITAQEIIDQLAAVPTQEIVVHINSGGGDATEGVAIARALKDARGKGKRISCQVDGLCASAAVNVALACSPVRIPRNAYMMIHDPACFQVGLFTASEMRKSADQLDTVKRGIVAGYAERTGLSNGHIVNIAPFDHIPEPLEAAGLSPKEEETMEIKNLEDLKAAYPDLVAQLVDAAKLEGQTQERQRLQAIDQVASAVSPELLDAAKYEKPVDARDLLFQAAKEGQLVNRTGAAVLAGFAQDAQTVNAVGGFANSGAAPGLSPEQAKKAQAEAAAAKAFNAIDPNKK